MVGTTVTTRLRTSKGPHNPVASIAQKSAGRSRSGSPLHAQAGQSAAVSSLPSGGGGGSFIPQPRSLQIREKTSEKNQSRPSSTSSTSSVSQLPIKSGGVTYRQGGRTGIASQQSAHAALYQHSNNNNPVSSLNNNNNSSMLDKFKLFNSKDKTSDRTKGGAVSKRTSSSSGFSSARSERSDSSTSLCSEPKTTPDGIDHVVSELASTTPSSQHGTSLPSSHPAANDAQPAVAKGALKSLTKKPFSRSKQISSAIKVPARDDQTSKSSSKKTDDKKLVKPTSKLETDPKSAKAVPSLPRPENGVRVSKISNLKKTVSSSVLSDVPDTVSLPSQSPTIVSLDNMDQSSTDNGVSSPGGIANQQSGVNSGIPKPTAAVKGTSKPPLKEDKKADENGVYSKLTNEDIYVPVNIAPQDLPGTLVGADGVAMDRASLSRSRSDRGRDGIAMVSPIMSNAGISKGDPETDKDRKSSVSSMQDSGVTSVSSDSATSAKEAQEESDEVMLNIKPMMPILRATPYGYTRSLGPLHSTANGRPLSSRIHGSPSLTSPGCPPSPQRLSLSRHGLANQEQYRFLGSGISSLKHILDADYGVDGDLMTSSADLASGYLSDGDVLRISSASAGIYGTGSGRTSEDLCSGYMSEGGASLYGRRVVVGGNRSQSNSTNKLPSGKGSSSTSKNSKTINVLQDDSPLRTIRLDDSSSISSGISDTINEFSTDDNLTGSSLSSEPNNPYGSLKRGPRDGSSSKGHSTAHGEMPNGENSSTSRGIRKNHSESGSHASVLGTSSKSGKSSVKKTDSSMQTESSAFHHTSSASSSAAWKKYIQQQQLMQPQSQQQQLQQLQLQQQQQQQQQQQLQLQQHQNGQDGTHSTHSSHQSKKKGSSSSSSSSSGSKNKNLAVVNGITESFKPKSSKLALSKDELKQRPAVEGSVGSSGSIRGSCESLQTTGGKSSGNSEKKSRSYSVSGVMTTGSPGLVAYGQVKRSSGSVSAGVPMTTPNGMISNKVSSRSMSGSSKRSDKVSDITPSGSPNPGSKSTLERKGKVKVCANTQTTVHDLYMTGATALSDSEYSSLGRRYPTTGSSGTKHQYLLTSPTLGGLREKTYGGRTSAGLTNVSPGTADYVTLAGLHALTTRDSRGGPRLSVPPSKSGSESDNYVSLDPTSNYGLGGSYAWIRPGAGSSAASVASAPAGRYTGGGGGSLVEADSMESLASAGSSLHGQGAQRYLFPLSPVNPMASSVVTPSGNSSVSYGSSRSSAAMSHYIGGLLSRMNNKEEDVHGSSLSLVSTSSSLYSTAEEKQAHEIRKLRRELEQAHEKVATLTSQLTTNAHMVAAFEQSLSNMTTRLQHLTASAEQKDSEMYDLRTTIEALKKQSAEAGLTKVALQSMQAVQRTLQEHRISRQLSTDSVSSVNSMSSACSTASKSDDSSKKKKSKKGWLRSSFSKAFSRSKKNRHGSVSDVEDPRQFLSDSSVPNSPLLGGYIQQNHSSKSTELLRHQHSSEKSESECGSEKDKTDGEADDLRKQLREKDMVLTDIRLEALTSAHQLEGLRETLNKVRNEMSNLKQDNERLQRLVSTKSLASSQSSLPLRNSIESLDKRLSVSEQSEPQSVDLYLNDAATDREGKRVIISVFNGSHGDFQKFKIGSNNRVLIGSVQVSGKTKWDLLDNVVKRTFKEYVLRVDPVSNLGLNAESVVSYHIGDVTRSKDSELPELLPCGYLVGDNLDIQVIIKGTVQNSVDALAFETLIPKTIVQRYMSLLTEHRRIILCGPSGTGKTYLAQKLAEFLVLKSGKDLVPGTVATFSVDHKSAKELRQYLSNVAEQCESNDASDLPTVIILDNLHHVGSLGEVFNGFLSAKYLKCPFIIGTMNQATCSTTNLQLHHNFRWVLCANHMEPVKGFLGRYLRRKLVDEEIRNGTRNPELTKIVDWMPKVWQQLNKFLETHSSSDVTIGPRLFLSCPLDINSSQVWYTDLWNYSIVPYLLEAVREGLQLYGRRAPWEDPAGWVIETYPWACSPGSRDWPQLVRLRPEDVGYEGHPGPGGMGAAKNLHSGNSDVETDPLLNMLMRLQEAATYSSPHSNDSDSTSQDGHSSGGGSGLHPDDVLNAGMESTL